MSKFKTTYSLSPELEEIAGPSPATSSEITSRVWKYVRDRNLQDPSDRRHVLCDAALQAVFKAERVSMFDVPRGIKANTTKVA